MSASDSPSAPSTSLSALSSPVSEGLGFRLPAAPKVPFLPGRRREGFLVMAPVLGFRCPMRWWCGGLARGGFLEVGRGPAELPREFESGLRDLGVPGPREDCRRAEEVGGMERWWGFKRRRLGMSDDGERGEGRGFNKEEVAGAVLGRGREVVDEEVRWEGRAEVLRGDGDGWRCRGCAKRDRGLPCATVVEGPAFPESGCRGVELPVWGAESGGGRVVSVDVFRREGSCGSMEMAPSFWRSRILKSRRLICRSSLADVNSRCIWESKKTPRRLRKKMRIG